MDGVELMPILNSFKAANRELVAETDWLASTPVFYDLKRGVVSSKIQEITSSIEGINFHPEGLYNFLDYGYSVFGQTPINDVLFLPHSSRIWRNNKGELEVEALADPFDQYADWRISESDVIELIRDRVQSWEASLPADQEIVLPLSGGFDSRLLLWCLRNPARIRAYTYGLSGDQSLSSEVIYAGALAKKFSLNW
jgi:asparagine synthetase B (glutamine-hydrolysing)